MQHDTVWQMRPCRIGWAGLRIPELNPEPGDVAAMQSEGGDGRWGDITGIGNTCAKALRQDQAPKGQCDCRVVPAGFHQPGRSWYVILSIKDFLAEFKCSCKVVLIYILRYYSSFCGAEKSLVTLAVERKGSWGRRGGKAEEAPGEKMPGGCFVAQTKVWDLEDDVASWRDLEMGLLEHVVSWSERPGREDGAGERRRRVRKDGTREHKVEVMLSGGGRKQSHG